MVAGGSSASMVSSYEGGERVGGKLMKRLHHRIRANPYDRPPIARGKSWISTVVVDPAKKLIAASARTFISSVFPKRLPPPPPTLLLPPPVAIPESSNGLQDPVLHNEVLQSVAADSHHVTTEDNGLPNELLQLLKHNTFTRHEVDHLTKLLESKAQDLPVIDDVRRVKSKLSKPSMDFQKPKEYSSVENSSERDRSYAVLEEDITFPIELANEYMGSNRISKGSLSKLTFHDQFNMEDGDLSNGVLRSMPETSRHIDDQGNSLATTPRFRARSIIHKMASSRMHSPPFHKESGPSGKSLTSPISLKQDGEHGLKELSRKRSSAVLDDFGSVGSIRRIKRKYGLVSHKFDEKDNYSSGQPFSLTGNYRSFMDDWRLNNKDSKLSDGVENTNNNNTSTRSFHIPSKIVPKVKQVEANRKRTPFKLTNDMLSGKALKSIESVDFLKLLNGNQNGEKLEGSYRDDVDCISQKQNEETENVPEEWRFPSRNQIESEENDPETSHLQLDFTSQKRNEAGENGSLFQLDFTSQKHDETEKNCPENSSYHQFDTTTLSADGDHFLESFTPDSRTISVLPKKHAFMMCVPEDFLDPDEDTCCNGPASVEKNTLPSEENTGSTVKLILDKSPLVEETKTAPPEPVTMPDSSPHVSAELPNLPLQLRPLPPSPFSLDKSKDVKSPSSLNLEASQPKSSSWIQPEPLRPVRLNDAADLSLQVPESGQYEGNFSRDSADAKEKVEIKSSFAFSSSMSTASPSNIQNSPVKSSHSPSLGSTSFGNQANLDSPPNVSSSGVSTTPVPVLSTFMFGASDKTSTGLVPAVITKNEADHNKEVNVVSSASMSSPFGSSTSIAIGSTSSTVESQPQSSEIGSGALNVSQSIPFQFGSSTSGNAPFIDNNTASSSSSSSQPTTTLFGSVPSFSTGSSSSTFNFGSTASSGPGTVISSNGTTSNVFNFGSTVSSGPNLVSFSNGTAPNVFNFGATLQTPKSDTFTATFNQTPSSVFSFGASSSLNTTTMPFGASSTPSIFTNHDQMNGEDSMSEDPIIQPSPSVLPLPVAGGFSFGSATAVQPVVASSAFQFNGQQNQASLQNNTFQGSGSLEFNAGGSFSLGSVGGEDKSGRKYVKVNRNRHRKK